jgi:hypothetical protein
MTESKFNIRQVEQRAERLYNDEAAADLAKSMACDLLNLISLYNAMEDRLDELEPPWTYIVEGEDETLPDVGEWMLLSIDNRGTERKDIVAVGMWTGRDWLSGSMSVVQPELDGIPYAYQPLPKPAPYPQRIVGESSTSDQEC